MTLRELDNDRETVCDEQAMGIRHGVVATGTLRFTGTAPVIVQRARKPKPGIGQHRMNYGYDREVRAAAAPERDAFYADRSSQWARAVPMNERGR